MLRSAYSAGRQIRGESPRPKFAIANFDLSPQGEVHRVRGLQNYFGGCFGTMALSFSRSMMFIFMPLGITMSPGFWSGLQAPSHFASMVVAESRGAPLGPRSLCEVDFTV